MSADAKIRLALILLAVFLLIEDWRMHYTRALEAS